MEIYILCSQRFKGSYSANLGAYQQILQHNLYSFLISRLQPAHACLCTSPVCPHVHSQEVVVYKCLPQWLEIQHILGMARNVSLPIDHNIYTLTEKTMHAL